MNQHPTLDKSSKQQAAWILEEPLTINPEKDALRIALIYLVVGVFWILLSDEFLFWILAEESYHLGQRFKGWFYVGFTAILLYGLVLQRMRLTATAAITARTAYAELQQHYEELTAAETELQYQNEFIEGLVEDAPGIIMVWDLSGEIKDLNPYGRRVLVGEFGGMPTIPDIIGLDLSELQEALLVSPVFRCERTDWPTPDQRTVSILWQSRRLQTASGPNHGDIISIGTDITEKHQLEEQLESLAYQDKLTELPNRQHLQRQMDGWLAEAATFALVVIDMDHFQDINDTLGHGAGDAFLQYAAKQLQSVLDPGDYLARIGGDEFGFLWPELADAAAVRTKLEAVFGLFGTWAQSGHEFAMNFSAGAALSPQHGQSTEELLRSADTALNNAKRLGRGRCSIYSQDVQERNLRAIKVASGIRRALEKDEFQLYFQPQIEMATGRVLGAEALIRWLQPDGNWLPPVSFIPLAEDTGQIFEIDLWVMAAALKEKQFLEANGCAQTGLSINVSSRSINQPQILQKLSKMILDARIDASGLIVEVTETALLDNIQSAGTALATLKELGVSLALDDFGTGYSSLEFLSQWPIDIIKLDRSFIGKIGLNEKNEAIIRIVLKLANELKYRVVAEGVETETQRDFLSKSGCSLAQGYLFHRPMPWEQFHHLLQNNGSPTKMKRESGLRRE